MIKLSTKVWVYNHGIGIVECKYKRNRPSAVWRVSVTCSIIRTWEVEYTVICDD